MIIYWEDKNNTLDISERSLNECVTELLRAHRRGHHLVILDRNICKKFFELELSGMDREMLSKIEADFTQNGNIIRNFLHFIRVQNTPDCELMIDGGQILMPYKLLTETNYLDKPKMLVENMNYDGYIYDLILRKRSINPISFEIVHGGGTDIYRIIDNKCNENYLSVTIIDSDKKSSLDENNVKINKINSIINKYNYPLAYTFIPDCREVENLIPFNLIKMIPSYRNKKDLDILLGILNNDSKSSLGDFWRFFDIKNGINKNSILLMKSEERKQLEIFMSPLNITDPNAVDSVVEITGFGNNVIKHVKEFTDSGKIMSDFIALEDWNSIYGHMFDEIIQIFTSSHRIYV